MSGTFHINGHGEPAPCKAPPGECPLGGEHYRSAEEAAAGYEASQSENLHPVHRLMTNEKELEDSFNREPDDSAIDGITMEEGLVLEGLDILEKRISVHRKVISEGAYKHRLTEYSEAPVEISHWIDEEEISRKWRRQDYDSIRLDYARAYSKANDFGGIYKTPEELVKEHRRKR